MNVNEIIHLYQSGLFIKEIAAIAGLCSRTVRRRLADAGHKILLRHETDRVTRTHAFDTRFFQHIDTEAKAYWLGFICADGHIWRGCRVEVGLAEIDRAHLVKLRDAVGSDYEIRTTNHAGYGDRSAPRLGLNSHLMVDDLACHGVVSGSVNRFPPPSLPDHLWRHYWRGLFDGDGAICFSTVSGGRAKELKKQWQLTLCGTLSCVTGFYEWVQNITKTTAKVTGPKSKIFYFTQGGLRRCQLLSSAMYDSATVFLDRKMVKHKELAADAMECLPLLLNVNGVTKHIGDWAAETGIPRDTIAERVYRFGWSPERAIGEPLKRDRVLTINGETKTISEWSLISGVPVHTINGRLRRGSLAEPAVFSTRYACRIL